MRIGFVIDDRLDKPDGVQQYVTLLGAWLSQQGHEVHYLVGHSPNAKQNNVHNLSKTLGVRFNKNRMAIPLPASSNEIKQILSKYNFDVLHVQMPYSPLLASKVIKAAGDNTAVVGTFHILPHGIVSALGTKLLSKIVSRSKQRFDGFISVSEAARLFAKSHFGIDSKVLPNVVDLTSYKQGMPINEFSDKKNIIFLGRFVERKGAHHLLGAFKALIQKHPEIIPKVRLILCGDGPDRSMLESIANKLLAVGADIEFTGFLPEKDKKNYLATADIAVFPSTGGESFGIVLIEAMAAGSKSVLGGDNPGYATVLGEYSNSLIQPENYDEFAARIYELLNNDLARSRMHSVQQECVRRYDINHVGPQIIEYYKQALALRKTKQHN